MNPDTHILSANAVNLKEILRFYGQMYPERKHLPHIREWLGKPLVMLHQDRVIGHAGRISFSIFWNNRAYPASWFIDFALLPEFRGLGLGTLLAQKWMEFPEICVTMANDQSMQIFLKAGWVETFDSYLHHFLIRPFHHPKIAPKIPSLLRTPLNLSCIPFLKTIYRRHAVATERLQFEPVTEQALASFQSRHQNFGNGCEPVRDAEYISWRLLTSPDRDKYCVVNLAGFPKTKAVIKRRNDKKMDDTRAVKQMELLWVSDPKSESLIPLIATLGLWCFENDYAYLRFYTTNPQLSQILKKSLKSVIRRPRFAFYAKDKSLMEKLKKTPWHWELIDSDFEFC